MKYERQAVDKREGWRRRKDGGGYSSMFAKRERTSLKKWVPHSLRAGAEEKRVGSHGLERW